MLRSAAFLLAASGTDAADVYDAVIVGGGWSGLAAAKYAKAEGLNAVVLEKRNSYAGAAEVEAIGTASVTTAEFSDLPMDIAAAGQYPSESYVVEYLKKYASEFKLEDSVKLNTEAVSVSKKSDVWVVTDQNGETYSGKQLIVGTASGSTSDMGAAEKQFKGFKGSVVHSSDKDAIDGLSGKKVLIYGTDASGSFLFNKLNQDDSGVEAVDVSVPRGQWFVPQTWSSTNKYWNPYNESFPMDYWTSELMAIYDPAQPFPTIKSQGCTTKLDATCPEEDPSKCGSCAKKNQMTLGMAGCGVEDVKKLCGHRVKRGVLQMLNYLNAKPDVTSCKGDTCTFTDGSTVKADVVVLATGTSDDFKFLDGVRPKARAADAYKLVFDAKDPSLAFVGFARPVLGSATAAAEVQARVVAAKVAGKFSLDAKLEATAKEDSTARGKAFGDSAMVELAPYLDDLSALIGASPSFPELFGKDPALWWLAMRSPFHGSRYWLHDEARHAGVKDALSRFCCATQTTLQAEVVSKLMTAIASGPVRYIPASVDRNKIRIIATLKHFFNLKKPTTAGTLLASAARQMGMEFKDSEAKNAKAMLGLVQNFLASGLFDEWYFSRHGHTDVQNAHLHPGASTVVTASTDLKCSPKEAYAILAKEGGAKHYHPYVEEHTVVEWNAKEHYARDTIQYAKAGLYANRTIAKFYDGSDTDFLGLDVVNEVLHSYSNKGNEVLLGKHTIITRYPKIEYRLTPASDGSKLTISATCSSDAPVIVNSTTELLSGITSGMAHVCEKNEEAPRATDSSYFSPAEMDVQAPLDHISPACIAGMNAVCSDDVAEPSLCKRCAMTNTLLLSSSFCNYQDIYLICTSADISSEIQAGELDDIDDLLMNLLDDEDENEEL